MDRREETPVNHEANKDLEAGWKRLEEKVASNGKLLKLLGLIKQRPLTKEESQEFVEACGLGHQLIK